MAKLPYIHMLLIILQILNNVLSTGPVTEVILCFVCQFYVKSILLYNSPEMRVSLVENKKHCPFLSISGLNKPNVTGVFQIRNISLLLLLTHLLIPVYHDVGATSKFTFSESSEILYYKFLFFTPFNSVP